MFQFLIFIRFSITNYTFDISETYFHWQFSVEVLAFFITDINMWQISEKAMQLVVNIPKEQMCSMTEA